MKSPAKLLSHEKTPSAPVDKNRFHPKDVTDLRATARAFLRGAAPQFSLIRAASVIREKDVENICRLIDEGATAIQVFAPVAEGLTTVLMQTAYRLLKSDTQAPLYWYSGGRFPIQAPSEDTKHIVIVDDAHDIETFPTWISDYGGPAPVGVLLLGCREMASSRLAKLGGLKWLRLPLQKITGEDVGFFVGKIAEFGAADRPELDLAKLFLKELNLNSHGGLFPAMYAATRGELLENRYRRLVEMMPNEDLRLEAVASLAFRNMLYISSRANSICQRL